MRYFIADINISEEIKSNLSKHGAVIYTKPLDNLYAPVNMHPDIQIHFLTNNMAICCPELYEYYKNILPEFVNLMSGKNQAGRGYPDDASYNAAVFGNNLVCNLKYIDNYIHKYYSENSYNIIHVNQGYARCNICAVSEIAVITEDIGIAAELEKHNIDVCVLEKKEISLKNFEYGFIGGTTGFIDENTIAFYGDIKKHSEFDKINEFIKKYNKEIVLLSDDKLMDYGGIISFYK